MNESGRGGPVIADETIDRAIIEALRGQELSGFEIWRWLGSAQGIPSRLTEAHLYPTLYRLEAEGLLQSDWHAGERTRRKYRPTARALERADEPDWSPAGSRVNQGQFASARPRGASTRQPRSRGRLMVHAQGDGAAAAAAAPAAAAPGAPCGGSRPRRWQRRPAASRTGRPDRQPAADRRSEPGPASGEDGRPGRAAWRPTRTTSAPASTCPGLSGTGSARRSRITWPIPPRALEQHGYGPEAAASEAISRLGSPRDEATLDRAGGAVSGPAQPRHPPRTAACSWPRCCCGCSSR